MNDDTFRPGDPLPTGVRRVEGGFQIPCTKKTNCPIISFHLEEGAIMSDKGVAIVWEDDAQLDALEALLTARRLARAR